MVLCMTIGTLVLCLWFGYWIYGELVSFISVLLPSC